MDGNAKYVNESTGRQGSYARKSARVNARVSGTWDTDFACSLAEREVALRLASKLERQLDAFDAHTQARHDAAAAMRSQRAQEKAIEAAAKEYATAMVLYECMLWNVDEVDDNLDGLMLWQKKEGFPSMTILLHEAGSIVLRNCHNLSSCLGSPHYMG